MNDVPPCGSFPFLLQAARYTSSLLVVGRFSRRRRRERIRGRNRTAARHSFLSFPSKYDRSPPLFLQISFLLCLRIAALTTRFQLQMLSEIRVASNRLNTKIV